MRITILAHGSRGDVQPYLALALGLAQAGHRVRLAAPEIFRETVETRANSGPADRLQFAPLAGDPAQLMYQAANPGLLRLLPTPLRNGLITLNYVRPVIDALVRDIRQACQGADLVIHSLLTATLGHIAAAEVGARDISALVFPVFTPTQAFPNPLFPPWPGWAGRFGERYAAFAPRYNYLTHREFNRVFWRASQMGLKQIQKRNPSLQPPAAWPYGGCQGEPVPVLYGISPSALPPPPEWQGTLRLPPDPPYGLPEQGPRAHLCGYWFLDSPGWQPPEGLLRFLEAGPPPVFIGFGSLIPKDAGRLARISLEALEQSGQRGLLLAGWGGLSDTRLPAWAYTLHEAPFDWLFPRMAAAVHHGGMGTTAAALRAGIPSIIIPFAFDQPFWGRQVHALGAGPRAISPKQLSAGRLAAAIRAAVENADIRRSTQALGERIRQEDGVAEAVRWIEANQ